jgi:hypothetical protein
VLQNHSNPFHSMLFPSPRFLLVLRPLLQRKAGSLLATLLIVIDALDECGKAERHQAHPSAAEECSGYVVFGYS